MGVKDLLHIEWRDNSMEGKTHMLGGVSAGLLYAIVTKTSFVSGGAALAATAVVGSLFPDLDISTSMLGSKIKPVSCLANKILGHRTLFHSPVLYMGIYAVSGGLIRRYPLCWIGFLLGVVSHLFLDLLNHQGIPLFYPFSKKFHLANLEYGGKAESVIRILMSECIALMVAKMCFWL